MVARPREVDVEVSVSKLCEAMEQSFLRHNELRDKFNGKMLNSISSVSEYCAVLKSVLGESRYDTDNKKEDTEDTVAKIFGDFFRQVAGTARAPMQQAPLWYVFQHFSPYHRKLIWKAKVIVEDLRKKHGAYLSYLDYWYDSATAAGEIMGFYNLLLNAYFLRTRSTTDKCWVPRSVVFHKENRFATSTKGLGVIGLRHLIEWIGPAKIDSLRRDLEKTVPGIRPDEERLRSLSEQAKKRVHAVDEQFREGIENFVGGILKRSGSEEHISKLREELVKALCTKSEPQSSLRLVLQKDVPRLKLLSTIMFILLHEPKWNFYYYFILRASPDTSSSALVVATHNPISKKLSVCIHNFLSVVGSAFALVETKAMEEREARRTMAYFSNLQAHSFTKQFTTPIANEAICLRFITFPGGMQNHVRQLRGHLDRCEIAVQSSARIGVGMQRQYYGGLEAVDCLDLLRQVRHYALQRINFRFNDLYDDPTYDRYAPKRLPEPNISWKNLVEVGQPKDISNRRHAAILKGHKKLILYHLQSLVQNAVEALDLAVAADTGQPERLLIWWRPFDEGAYIEIGISNTGKKRISGEICEGVAEWQKDIVNPAIERVSWPQLSTKSGGHTGSGLLLAAAYCKSLKRADSKKAGELVFYNKIPFKLDEDVKRFRTTVALRLPTEEVEFDHEILRKVPKLEPPKLEEITPSRQQGNANTAALPKNLKSLIVEDDTADRRRFRLAFGQYPQHMPLAFAWDAKRQEVWSVGSLIKVMRNNPECQLFLDLAWSRHDETLCDELRGAASMDEFKSILDKSRSMYKPSGLDLLKKIEKDRNINNPVVVVTAYRFPLMEEYCLRRYKIRGRVNHSKNVTSIFMKWSDENDLSAYLLR